MANEAASNDQITPKKLVSEASKIVEQGASLATASDAATLAAETPKPRHVEKLNNIIETENNAVLSNHSGSERSRHRGRNHNDYNGSNRGGKNYHHNSAANSKSHRQHQHH